MTQAVADVQTELQHALLARAQAGDRRALEALWSEHRRWVAVVLLAHKPASVDLEDLLQDVAMTLVARVADVRDPACFKGWLRMVALNAARAAGRSVSARSQLRLHRVDTDGVVVNESACCEVDRGSGHDDEAARVLGLVERLPAEYREPLLLRSLNELTYRQIARLLELPETTIETRIARARRMLRELADTSDTATVSAVAR